MDNLRDLIERSFAQYPDRVAIRVLGEGDTANQYQPISYAELGNRRDRLACGLASLGLRRGHRIGILTDGGIEPILVFLAADLLGLTAVPLCHKTSKEILVHSISSAGLEMLVVDGRGQKQFEVICSALHHEPRILKVPGTQGQGLSWEEAQAEGSPPSINLHANDESKILFTSGSSGLPKGVVQTHQNIVANVQSVWDVISLAENFRFFKSAPDYHSMGILNIYFPLAKGWTLDLARSPDRVLSDIRHSAPQGFLTVPLVLDKVYGNVRKEIDAGGLKGRLVARAVGARQRRAHGRGGVVDALIDRTLGAKVVAAIKQQLAKRVGGQLEVLVVGSAKADPEALDFFQDVLGIATFEGYGTTECAPLIAANHLGGRKAGSVGRALFEVKLMTGDGRMVAHIDPASDLIEGQAGEIGELWVSGANVMTEYLNDPEQTARVLVEDEDAGKIWYRTGDLFTMDAEGFLTFGGRVGRQFKLGNGEFVNPELLERVYSRAPLVEHVIVTGKQEWSHPLIVATVDIEEASRQTDLIGLPTDEAALRQFDALTERLEEQLRTEADLAGLPGHERPVRVLVLPEGLSEETGTLTRGLRKVVPKAVVARFEKQIEAVMS
jgi:long-chain acyl-CoA synthetase